MINFFDSSGLELNLLHQGIDNPILSSHVKNLENFGKILEGKMCIQTTRFGHNFIDLLGLDLNTNKLTCCNDI